MNFGTAWREKVIEIRNDSMKIEIEFDNKLELLDAISKGFESYLELTDYESEIYCIVDQAIKETIDKAKDGLAKGNANEWLRTSIKLGLWSLIDEVTMDIEQKQSNEFKEIKDRLDKLEEKRGGERDDNES
jgi:hypothetical protein